MSTLNLDKIDNMVLAALDKTYPNVDKALRSHSQLAIAHMLQVKCPELKEEHISDVSDSVVYWQIARGII